MWKVCPRCRTLKVASDFPTRSRTRPRPTAYCFPCQKEYSRGHYRAHRIEHNTRRYANTKAQRATRRSKMVEYLSNHPCVDCGEADPVVLEFDHVRGEKSGEIANLLRRQVAWERIIDELSKCEVRCANCHRRRTARQFKWYRLGRCAATDIGR